MVKRVVLFVAVLHLVAGAGYGQWINQPVRTEGDDGAQQYQDWFYHLRTAGSGQIPEGAFKRALDQREAISPSHRNSVQGASANWTNIGPYNINDGLGGPHGGRINTVAIDPTNPNIAYFGGANGGVWKTVNGGDTWEPKSDAAPALAMGSIAIDPKHPSTVFAATGEYVRGAGSYFGAGILRSTDAGATWTPVGLANVGAFSKIVIHPATTNLIFAAGAGSGGGLYRSNDGGNSWMKLGGGLPVGDVTDLDLVASENGYVMYAAVPSHGIYKSTDGGDSWDQKHTYPQMRRMHVAAFSSDALDVIDLSIRYDGSFGGLSRSTDGGDNWTDISGNFFTTDPFSVAGGFQGWYDAYLIRDPKSRERFVLGGVSIWVTNDGGGSWTDAGLAYQGGIHPDQHAAAFSASTNTFYGACDGGITVSSDRGSNYDVRNDSEAITESYGLAIDQTVDDVTYIGTQDNGTLTGSSNADWDVVGGGDGEKVVVDSKNHNVIYFMRPTAFAVSKYTSANGESDISSGLVGSENDSAGWVKPLVQDETNHILYTGSQNLYVMSLNSTSSWARRGKKLATGSGSYITTIGPSGDGTSVLIGTSDGNVWTTTDNGLSFKAAAGLPGRAVMDIVVSPASKQTFYVALSGFGGGHMFRTTDFGVSWTDISGQLPDISCNKIVVDPTHPTHLYVATDVGVFYSPNDGKDWTAYGSGLPNVAGLDMALHYSKRVLRLATHGRSVWEAPMQDVPSGITSPLVASIWYIGEPSTISWYGVASGAKVEISTDDAKSWQTVSTNVSGSSFNISQVRYPETSLALVRVTSGSDVLLSQRFRITQRLAGSTMTTFSEQPLYMYDLAYDADDNALWITNFSTTGTPDPKIYKMDPNTGVMTGNITVTGGGYFTGIKYDSQTKHLFVHQSRQDNNLSFIFEIDVTGKVIHKWSSPCTYGTGILTIGDTLFVADRNNNVIHRVHKSNPANTIDDFDLTASNRTAAFGPRCLALNTKSGALYHTWTDFQGTQANATLYDSYILTLSRFDGSEQGSWFVQEGSNSGTNVRGIEYDPRSNGKQVWVTILNSGNSSKIVKITLVNGDSAAVPIGSMNSVTLSNLAADSIAINSPSTIKWTSTGDIGKNVSIDLSTDGKTTWNNITTVTSDQTSFAWTTPATASNNDFVRVTGDKSGTGSATSSLFRVVTTAPIGTIKNVTLTNLAGDSIATGSGTTIGWTASGDVGQNVKIELSIDGGTNWNQIGTTTSDQSSFPWTTPATVSNNDLIRVSGDKSGTGSATSAKFRVYMLDAVSSASGFGGYDISVYPNPVHGQTTVGYTLPAYSTVRIEMRDVLGREVYSTTYQNEAGGSHSHRISLGNLTSGGYTLAIYAGNTLVGVRSIALY